VSESSVVASAVNNPGGSAPMSLVARLRDRNPLPPGAFVVGLGLGLSGLATYVFFAITSRVLDPASYAAVGVLWSLLFAVGNGVMQPLEQEVARAVADRRARGIGAGPVIRKAVGIGAGFTLVLVLLGTLTHTWILDRLLDGRVELVVAFLVGFRVEGSWLAALGATALLLGFSYAFSWIQALIGLSVSSVEAANSAGFIWMFPLTFVSSAFVLTSSMPSWLATIADANPFTKLTNAARALFNGQDPGSDLWQAIAWAVGITVVFAFLAARKFARSASR